MALVTMGYPDPEERPWSYEQGYNNPRKVGHWHAFQLESIQQRYDLGIPLSVEEMELLNESRPPPPKPVQVEPVSTIVEPEPERPAPKRRRKKRDTSKTLMRRAIQQRNEDRELFN